MNITQKLNVISEIVGADAYKYMRIREALEHYEKETGNRYSVALVEIVDNFYKLCVHLTKE